MHQLFTAVGVARSRRLTQPSSSSSSSSSTSSCSTTSTPSSPAHVNVPPSSPFASFAGGKCKAAARSLGWRSVYMFVSLLALLGASGSQSRVIEFICKQLGGSNQCPPIQTCPVGEALYHKPHSKPTYDGCGTHGLKVSLSPTDFSSCCNLHDLCYGQCGRRKKECDEFFEACMLAQCQREHHTNSSSSSSNSHHHHSLKKHGGGHKQQQYQQQQQHQSKELKRCVRAAKLYYHAVYGLGCFAFRRAKAKHCECRPYEDAAAAATRGGRKRRKEEKMNDIGEGLLAVMQRAAQADTPTAGVSHFKWEELL